MIRQHWYVAAGIVALAGLLALAGAFQSDQPTCAQQDTVESVITVSGLGEVMAAPDAGQIEIGVHTQQRTAEGALETNSREMQAVVDALTQLGVDDADIQTSRFSVHPVYERREAETSVLVGFRAENRVRIRVRDLEKMGEVIDAAVQAGANQVHSIEMSVSDPADLEEEALRLAVRDARQRAEVAADESGVRIVGVRRIDIAGGGGAPLLRAESADSFGTPIMPGQVNIRVNVNVTFEISR
ncbi:MAG: SIMPL domain-containing protein [Bacillota bacterium]